MNYAYNEGGWTGPIPDWDTEEPIRPEGGYDVRRRLAANLDIEALVERTKSLIIDSSERLVTVEDEEDAQVDRPWREAD